MALSCASNQACRPAIVIGVGGRKLAVRPIEGESLEGMCVDALDVAHFYKQFAQRWVFAWQLVGEIGIRHHGQQVVPHAVVSANFIFKQAVHRPFP
jgi:hypothetical protein